MKILYISSETTPSYGGIGAYTYKIINELQKKYDDYEAVLLTCNQHQTDTFSDYFKNVDRIKIISLFNKNFKQIFIRDFYFQTHLIKHINKIIRREEIDIIHHQSGHYELFLAIPFLGDIPKIMISHGDTYALLKIWKHANLLNQNEKINYQSGRILYHEEKYLYKKSTKIITVANHVKQSIIENYGIEPEKINTIYNFVDPQTFYFHPGEFTKPYKIGFIGRPYYIKGFNDLITTLNQHSDKDLFEWHIVSDSKLIKEFVKNDKNIYYYSTIPQSELSHFYDDIDFMFIPSHSEAGPTVLLESLLKGKLCIARNIKGIREMMGDCKGYLFEDAMQLNFPNIVEKVMKKREHLLEILKNNREKIKQKYAPDKIICDLYNLYEYYNK